MGELVQGDITEQRADVIVNTANSALLSGGGVNGAIHRRGGPAILAACRELRASRYVKGLPVGEAVATTAGNLPARWVIHTVGPVYSQTEDRSDLLVSCYLRSLMLAEDLGAKSLAFPAISTGLFGWPVADSARLVSRLLSSARVNLDVRLVLFSASDLRLYEEALRATDHRVTDAEIVRVLAAVPANRWRALFEAADRITSADLEGIGSEAVENMFRHLFRAPLVVRCDYSDAFREGRRPESLTVAEAVRLITYIWREDYWNGGGTGVLEGRIRDGSLPAALGTLRRWVERSQPGAAHEGPSQKSTL
ncbi:O-acetyl-ADP-ribose deacetylase [Herbidospora cretacea]|uniref:O-acetyl-ADP-ribose deacetylase n=1 Tax=Herbidospora cretacea TaxID=28444 RepID=UPI0007C75C55